MIEAVTDISEAGANGVLFAFGTRFGGHALYVKDGRLHYVNSFVGAEEQMVVGDRGHPEGRGSDPVGLVREEGTGAGLRARHACRSTTAQTKVGEGEIKTQMGYYAIAGSALFVGRQEGEPVTDDYPGESPHAFTGGDLKLVAVNVSGEPFTDIELHAEMLEDSERRHPAFLARHAHPRGDHRLRHAGDGGGRAGLRATG